MDRALAFSSGPLHLRGLRPAAPSGTRSEPAWSSRSCTSSGEAHFARAGILAGLVALAGSHVRHGKVREASSILIQRRVREHCERNVGLDPRRLLKTMHQVGIGTPRAPPGLPAGPAASLLPNSPEAALTILEKRRESMDEARSKGGHRPSATDTDGTYRLPLLVKYHKPPGMQTSMRGLRKSEDLRTVVVMSGQEFELDLYHPVGRMSTKASGLFLWSRSGLISRHITDSRRGVVSIVEAEVHGAVDKEALSEALGNGVPVGPTGFQTVFHGEVREVQFVPESSLQEPRSRVVIASRSGKGRIPAVLKTCGYRLIHQRRLNLGALSLGSLKQGELEAATPEEEAWACQLAGLPASEYPAGYLPSDEASPRPLLQPEAATEVAA